MVLRQNLTPKHHRCILHRIFYAQEERRHKAELQHSFFLRDRWQLEISVLVKVESAWIIEFCVCKNRQRINTDESRRQNALFIKVLNLRSHELIQKFMKKRLNETVKNRVRRSSFCWIEATKIGNNKVIIEILKENIIKMFNWLFRKNIETVQDLLTIDKKQPLCKFLFWRLNYTNSADCFYIDFVKKQFE